MELVSVIIAIYNVENYVRRCVASVINQTVNNIEIILVNDGSTDSSGSICDELARFDSRIRVLHKENGGLSDARNAGLMASRGDFIAFVDGDDVVARNYIELLLLPLSAGLAQLSVCDSQLIDDQNSFNQRGCEFSVRRICYYSGFDALKMAYVMDKMDLSAWGKMSSRSLWESHPFPKGRVYEDLATVPGIFLQASTVAHIASPLYGQVMRRGSITRSAKVGDAQFFDYYRASEDACRLAASTNDSDVILAAACRQLITYARMKRLYKNLENIDEKTNDLYRHISDVLRKKARTMISSDVLPIRSKALVVFAAYAGSLDGFLFRALQLCRRIGLIRQ